MPASELSRRELLSGSAYLTIGAGTAALAPNASATEVAAPSGNSIHDIVLNVNGVGRTVKVEVARHARRSPAGAGRPHGNQDRL